MPAARSIEVFRGLPLLLLILALFLAFPLVTASSCRRCGRWSSR
jgi:ABC-type amino acid transport system permease subunit